MQWFNEKQISKFEHKSLFWMVFLTFLFVGMGLSFAPEEGFANHTCQQTNFPAGCQTAGHEPEPEPEPEPVTPETCIGPLALLATATPENDCKESEDIPNDTSDDPFSVPRLDDEEEPRGRTEAPLTCDIDVDCEDGVPHFELFSRHVPISARESRDEGLVPEARKIQGFLPTEFRGAFNNILDDAFDSDGDGNIFGNPAELGNMVCSGSFEGPPGTSVELTDIIPGPSCNILLRLRLLFRNGPDPETPYCLAITISDRRELVPIDGGGVGFKQVTHLWWCFEFDRDLTPTSTFMPDDPPPTTPDGGDDPDIVEIPLNDLRPEPQEQPRFEVLDVVINELGWPGTSVDQTHQFIELYNNSDSPIDLNGWVLQAPNGEVRVQLRGIIDAKGYFLLEHPNDETISDIAADQIFNAPLSDEMGSLELLDPNGRTIDTANGNGGAWPAGFRLRGIISCMERINPFGEDNDENWSNNDTQKRNGVDANGQALNCTPKAANSVRQISVVEPEGFPGRSFAESVSAFPIGETNAPAPQAPSFFGQVITVDDDGEADFSNLQAAVNAANPGDVIQLAPGTYSGQVLIRVDNLTIIGAGAAQTILEHTDVVVIFAGTRGGLLTGVTVRYRGIDPHAAVVVFSAIARLENNVITGATRAGVDVQGEGAKAFLKQNLIENNQGSGVFVHRDAQAELEANTILNNGIDGEAGVELKGDVIANLLNNLIEASGGSGVFIHEGAQVDLKSNLIVNNAFHGVSIPGMATVALKHNAILFNQQLGIRVRGENAELMLQNNLLAYNVIGILTVNNENTHLHQNLWFQNSEDTIGQGLEPEEANLNTALLFQSDFIAFSNGLELLRVSLQIQTTGSVMAEEGVIEGLQNSFLVVAQHYAEQGFLEFVGNWFLLVIQLDAESDAAQQAIEDLAELSNE